MVPHGKIRADNIFWSIIFLSDPSDFAWPSTTGLFTLIPLGSNREGCAGWHTLWAAFNGTCVTWQRRFHCSLLMVLIRQLCSGFIPKDFTHQSVFPWAIVSIEMCTLAADSLLTGLPALVKAPGSFSETKACKASFHTDNKRPSTPAAIYLPFNSCRLSFLAVVFSCLPAWPLVAVERSMWISGSTQGFCFFSPPNMSRCFDWPIKMSLKPLLISREASRNHKFHVGQGSTGNHPDSSISFFAFCRHACSSAEGERWGIKGGKGGGGVRLLPLHLCPSRVTADLGFRVLSGWVSCSSSLRFLAENPCPWEAGEALSCIHFRSAQRIFMDAALTFLTPGPQQTPPPCSGSAGWQAAVRMNKAGEDTHTVLVSPHHFLPLIKHLYCHSFDLDTTSESWYQVTVFFFYFPQLLFL